MPADAAITAEHLGKTFRTFDRRPGFTGAVRDVFQRRHREVVAVRDVSLSIARGEVIGYIGPNGAGKSTTIKMLTGIMVPTSGTVRVNGFDPHRERERYVQTVGAVFGQRTQLWWDLAVSESFELLRHLYAVPKADFDRRLKRCDEVLGLGEFLRTPVRKLSLGQRMKADIAASLLHQPSVLFLDEPTVGVDVVTKARLRDFLREWNRETGTTVLLTTHDMHDIEALCRRVIVIDRGQVMHDGDLDSLKDRYGARTRLVLTLRQAIPADLVLPAEGLTWERDSPLHLTATLAAEVDTAAVLQRLLGLLPVADVKIEEPTIEQVVQLLYAESAKTLAAAGSAGMNAAGDPYAHPDVAEIIAFALREDLRGAGDLTCRALVPPGARLSATITAKQAGVVCGLPLFARVFAALGGGVAIDAAAADGTRVAVGEVVMRCAGDATAMLTGERTALNLVQRLSATATLTRRFVDAVAGTGAAILDTRKTTPGLRLLQKHAVLCGGGRNHRIGLYDQALIKENHIALMPAPHGLRGPAEAVRRARAELGDMAVIEVEIETLADLMPVIAASADIVLLDNLAPGAIAEAVRQTRRLSRPHGARPVQLEASGGITLDSVRAFAETGVDRISVGALTHSSGALDLSMRCAPA